MRDVPLALVEQRVVESDRGAPCDLAGERRRDDGPPVGAGGAPDRQRAEAVPPGSEREHEQRRKTGAGVARRVGRARLPAGGDRPRDPVGPAVVVLELRWPRAATRDLVDHAVLVDQVNRREGRPLLGQDLDQPPRADAHGGDPLERLAHERQERAGGGRPLGLRLQLCALQRDADLLCDAQQQRPSVLVDPAALGRSREDRADHRPARRAQRECRERLDTQAAPLLLQGRVARVVLVSRPDRDEAPRPHRVRHHPAELERVHGEAIPCLLRHVGRCEGLEARRVADSPHEDDVRPELLELRDGRGRDLLDRRRGREPRGVPLHELRLPAGVALALEESRALERAAELLADGVQHPPLRFGELAVLPERDADRTDRARERDDDHRLDAGQQLLHVGRVQLPHTLSAVELHRLPRTHDVGGRRRGRERHGPPVPVLGAQVCGNLERAHVVARGEPDGAQRRIEGLEQERDARLRDLGRKCRRREARDEPPQDVRPATPFVVDRAEPGALERDATLLCDTDDDGSHVGNEPARSPRARDECADDRSAGAGERHGEHRREMGAVRIRLRRLNDAAGSHRLFRNCVRRVDVLRGTDRGQRLDRVAPPHAHGGHLDSRPREIGDGRRSDLLRAGGGREVRGVALQQLRTLASCALGIVRLPQAPLGRGARQCERTEQDGEDRPSHEDRERRGMRGALAARSDDPAAASERERPSAPTRRWCVRRVGLRTVDAQANPELGRQALEHVGDDARAEPGADVADGSLAAPGRRVHRSKRLEAAAAGDERDQAGEGRPASRAGPGERRSAGRLARQVEPDEGAPRTSFRPDRDDRDVRGPLAGGSEHTGPHQLGDAPASRRLEPLPLGGRHDLGQREGVGRPDRPHRPRVCAEARIVHRTLRVHEARRGPEARHDATEAVLQRLVRGLRRAIVLDVLPVFRPRPQEPRHRDGRDRDQHDERPADERGRGDASPHARGDSTRTAMPCPGRRAAGIRPTGRGVRSAPRGYDLLDPDVRGELRCRYGPGYC